MKEIKMVIGGFVQQIHFKNKYLLKLSKKINKCDDLLDFDFMFTYN